MIAKKSGDENKIFKLHDANILHIFTKESFSFLEDVKMTTVDLKFISRNLNKFQENLRKLNFSFFSNRK